MLLLTLGLAVLAAQSDATPFSVLLGERGPVVQNLVADEDGKTLYSLDGQGVIQAWDVAARERLWTAADAFPYTGLALGDERLVTTPGMPRRKLDNGGVTCLALDDKDKTLAIGGADGTVRFLNPKTSKVDEKNVLEGHTDAITAMAWSKSDLAVATANGELWIWAASKGKRELELEAQDAVVHSLVFGGKGKWLAAGNAQGEVRFFDTKSGARKATLTGEAGKSVRGLVIVDKGKSLAAATDAIDLWDLVALGLQ